MVKLKTFTSKCTPQAIEYLDQHANEWIEKTKAVVKNSTMSFGVVEGKGGQKEPLLFINIWYEVAE